MAVLSSLARVFLWCLVLLTIVAARPETLRPLDLEAEETLEVEEFCTSGIVPSSVRIRRPLPARGHSSSGVSTPTARSADLAASRKTYLFISTRGHKLPNGLNAPLLM